MITPGKWKDGLNADCVVSDHADADGFINAGQQDEYGGILICENVQNPHDKALIKAAPKLLAAVDSILANLAIGRKSHITFGDAEILRKLSQEAHGV